MVGVVVGVWSLRNVVVVVGDFSFLVSASFL